MAWAFSSHEQLVHAGYRFRTCVDCRRCGQAVAIYSNPDGRAIAVDRVTFQPHYRKCPALRKKSAPATGNLFEEPPK